MKDVKKYYLSLYHDGVSMKAGCRGIERYRTEREFLDRLTGRNLERARPPDEGQDFYPLSDEQLDTFSKFRKGLRSD